MLYYLWTDIIELFPNCLQADWKPESPNKFGDIAELIKSLDLVKIEDKKPSGSMPCLSWYFSYELCLLFFEEHGLIAGQGPKSAQASVKPSAANPPAQKPAAYRPPHAKSAAAIQAEVHRIYDYCSVFHCFCFKLFIQIVNNTFAWHNLFIVMKCFNT